ncbi:MAG: hypothetical protein ABIQ35_11680 [Verrucomicrobiota bacterium]
MAASDIFLRTAGLTVDPFRELGAGLLPFFFAAQRAFIIAEIFALPAADMLEAFFGAPKVLRVEVFDLLPALTLAQRALARADSRARPAAEIPEVETGVGDEPSESRIEESSASSRVISSLSCTARLSWSKDIVNAIGM